MNTLVVKRSINQIAQNITIGKPIMAALLFSLFFLGAETQAAIRLSLTDAYLQVSVFVAGTLGGLFLLERTARTDLDKFLRSHQNMQVLVAATLGALPGCGGAIMVTTQYVRGTMSFGGVVAVLSATMGDAAFLLLVKEPLTAALVFITCFVTGIISGTIVDWIHGSKFLRVKYGEFDDEVIPPENELLSPFYRIWMAFFIPGAIAGLMIAFQLDPTVMIKEYVGIDLVGTLAVTAAILSVVMWVLNPISDFRLLTSCKRTLERRVCDTTNFVTLWVIVGYVVYELIATVYGFDIKSLFDGWAPLVPLIALLIGFIPGCGPQIVITTLYLNGIIPLSALMANAISNDGDALFPTIVVAPRAAIIATLYTAIPAVIVGYGYYFIFEY